jgi:hypothetical protein
MPIALLDLTFFSTNLGSVRRLDYGYRDQKYAGESGHRQFLDICSHYRLFQKIFPGCDQTCQTDVNDSVRDWQWFGLDGIT